MKKKMLSMLLALVMVLAMVPAPAFAADSGFTIEDGVLTKYTGPGGNVVIPDGVTEIGPEVFMDCTSLTSVTIPNSVTEIGYLAFEGCTGLTAIEVDAGNQNYASVDGVLFTKDMKILMAYPGGKKGAYAIPSSVTEIWDFAFADCTGLTSVTIPNSVTTTGDWTFYGCTGLTSVTIPNSVTEIMPGMFTGCTGLTSVTIPNSVTSIWYDAFTGCTNLTTIEVDAGNQSYASVDGVLFSKDMKTLEAYPGGKKGAYAIPNSVTAIGYSAFTGCTSLTSVTIPNSVTEIGYLAFTGCTGLTAIEVDAGNQNYVSVDGVLFTKDMKTLDAYPDGKKGAYAIPSSVTEIGWLAFEDCTGLTSVTIPNSVTEIGISAFSDCTSLTSVTIPNSVTTIGGAAFSNCTGLTSVTIPNSVTVIWGVAFSGCTGLTAIEVDAGNQNYASVDGVLFSKDMKTLEAYPGGKKGAYAIPSSVTVIQKSAFSNCTGLTSVTIPNSVTKIESFAFSGCTGLKDVYYGGTEAQWNAIEGDFRDDLTSATIHYNSTGPDKPEQPEQPASWAKADVDRAIAANILPAELRGAYGQPATRREFCLLADALYTAVKGSAAPADPAATFTDTTDPAVLRMASVGVVTGVGNGAFNPNGQLNREQAATMLARLASALGKPLADSEPTFADSGSVSGWAKAAVGQMQKSGVMGGVGNNQFSPAGSYTREQSTVTIMRLYDRLYDQITV